MEQIILSMENITKRFGKVVANSKVNFDLRRGEVHALLGENGAGKTTLMNILDGIYTADSGTIRLYGKPVDISSPQVAIKNGIGMVHQHFMLVPPMTVIQNIILGQERNLKGLDIAGAQKKVAALCEEYHFDLNLDARVEDLSVGEQQRVELVKALYRGADILILDEPTAVLTPQEVEELFVVLQQFVQQGKSIIIISHKLWEVKQIANRITILQNGQYVDTVNNEDVTREDLASMMVGKKVTFEYKKTAAKRETVLLEFRSVFSGDQRLAASLKDVSFCLYSGEILGIAGVDGNGQTRLAEIAIGLVKPDSGSLYYQEKDIAAWNVKKRIEQGFAHISEDRMTQGLIMDFTVAENMVLNAYDKAPYTVKGVYRLKAVREIGKRLSIEYDVRPRASDALAKAFSGGNQQKIVIAREFNRHPKLIIAMQPTRGLDIGASQFVHHRLLDEKEAGAGIVMVSADLDEILDVADRVLVINEGRIMGEFVPGQISLTQIGLMMGGQRQKEEPAI